MVKAAADPLGQPVAIRCGIGPGVRYAAGGGPAREPMSFRGRVWLLDRTGSRGGGVGLGVTVTASESDYRDERRQEILLGLRTPLAGGSRRDCHSDRLAVITAVRVVRVGPGVARTFTVTGPAAVLRVSDGRWHISD